jgi:hypothetical protein
MTGVPKFTIARVVQQKEKLRDEWTLRYEQGTSQKRKREGKDPDVGAAISVVTRRGVRVSGQMLKSTSEDKNLNHNDSKATDGWLYAWKCRFGIQFKKAQGEKGSVDAVSAEKWKSTKLPNLLQKFCADDICNADERGLFYCATPNSSLSYKHATSDWFKESNGSCNCIVLFKHVRN